MLKPTVIMIKILFVTSIAKTAVFIRYLRYRSVPFRRYYRCPKWFSRTCFSFVTFCCLHVYLYIHSYLKPDEIGFLPWTDLIWFCLFFVFVFLFVFFFGGGVVFVLFCFGFFFMLVCKIFWLLLFYRLISTTDTPGWGLRNVQMSRYIMYI